MDGGEILRRLADDTEVAAEIIRDGWTEGWIYLESDGVPTVYFSLDDCVRFLPDTLEKYGLADAEISFIRKSDMPGRQRDRVRKMRSKLSNCAYFGDFLKFVEENLFKPVDRAGERCRLVGATLTDEDMYYLLCDETGTQFTLDSAVGKLNTVEDYGTFSADRMDADALREKLSRSCDIVIAGPYAE